MNIVIEESLRFSLGDLKGFPATVFKFKEQNKYPGDYMTVQLERSGFSDNAFGITGRTAVVSIISGLLSLLPDTEEIMHETLGAPEYIRDKQTAFKSEEEIKAEKEAYWSR